MNIRLNIQQKIIGSIVSVIFITFLVLTIVNINNYSNDLTDSFRIQSKSIVNSLDSGIYDSEILNSPNKIFTIINKNLWLFPEIIEINFNVFNENNWVTVSSSNPSNIDQLSTNKNLQLAFENDETIDEIVGDTKTKIMRVFSPVHVSGQKVGVFQVDFSLKSIKEKINNNQKKLFLLYIITMIITVIFLNFFIKKLLISPIIEINQGLKQIHNNNFNFNLEIQSNDEIGDLANSFNLMKERIHKSKNELEKKVEEKTEDLAKKVKLLSDIRDITFDSEILTEKMFHEKKQAYKLLEKLNKRLDRINKKIK